MNKIDNDIKRKIEERFKITSITVLNIRTEMTRMLSCLPEAKVKCLVFM